MTTRTDTPGSPMVHGGTPILADVRRRFGGIDTPAAIVGALTAIGVIAFLTALLAAGSASIAFQMDLIDTEGAFSDIDVAGFAVALGVVFVGFLVGGWAAGRMARYDGGKNGLAAAFWMLVLIVGFAAAGALISEESNAFATTDLPDWMSQVAADDATTVGIVAAAVAVIVMFLGGWLGGRLGETYHHHVDAAVAHAARHPEQVGRTEHQAVDDDSVGSRTDDDQTRHVEAVAVAAGTGESDFGDSDVGDSALVGRTEHETTADDAVGSPTGFETPHVEPVDADTVDADTVDADTTDPDTTEAQIVEAQFVEAQIVEVDDRDDETAAASRMRAPDAGERDSTPFGDDTSTSQGATGLGRDENSVSP
jgi:hypothetical protein